jgi:hypothetical protein
MEKRLENYLYKKYPELFADHSKSMQETCMCWGIICNNGWLNLIDRLCQQITDHIKSQHQNVEWEEKLEKEKLEKGESVRERPEWSKEKIPQVKFHQVKEKFGELRVYHEGGDKEIGSMISFAEYLSRFICEDCGKFDFTVGTTTKGWIYTICKDCISKKPNDIKNTGWVLFDENKKSAKVFEEAMKDKEKNKGKEMALAFKEVEKIRSRSKPGKMGEKFKQLKALSPK